MRKTKLRHNIRITLLEYIMSFFDSELRLLSQLVKIFSIVGNLGTIILDSPETLEITLIECPMNGVASYYIKSCCHCHGLLLTINS